MMAVFRIGELDQSIGIWRPVFTPDGQGGQLRSEVLQHTLMAHVMARGGGENFKYEKIDAPAFTTFVIRNSSNLDIKENDLIKWGGDDYNIRAIQRTGGRSLYLEINAERGVAQ